jgi:AcrR family transcriptional regulator
MHGTASLPADWAMESVLGTRQQLRATALQLFVEQGYAAVSLRQLATALGVQVGSLYNHMENKQALLFELIEDHETDLLDALRAQDPRGGDARQRLAAYVETRINFNLKHPRQLALARFELRSLAAEQRTLIQALRLQQLRQLKGIVQQGIEDRSFRPLMVDAAAQGILAMLDNPPHVEASGTQDTAACIKLLNQMIAGALA